MDIALNDDAETVVHHWIVTGEPGPVPGYFDGSSPRFPAYRYVYSSADTRWPGDKAEAVARRFCEQLQRGLSGTDGWEAGPFLHHRTVTYGPLEAVPYGPVTVVQVPLDQATQPTQPAVAAGGLLCKCMNRDCPNPHFDESVRS